MRSQDRSGPSNTQNRPDSSRIRFVGSRGPGCRAAKPYALVVRWSPSLGPCLPVGGPSGGELFILLLHLPSLEGATVVNQPEARVTL